jgi:DNA polymerase-3 subunit gamma/tau
MAAANVDGITLEQVQATLGTIDAELVNSLVDTLVSRDIGTGLALIDKALDQGADLRQFARQIIHHLRGVLLIQLDAGDLLDVGTESLQRFSIQAKQISTPVLVQAIKRFNTAETDLRGGWQPQLPLELALVEVIMVPSREAGEPQASAHENVVRYQTNSEPVGRGGEKEPQQSRPETTEPSDQAQNNVSGGLTLEAVRQCWSQVLENARARDKSVQALLNSAHPGDVQEAC